MNLLIKNIYEKLCIPIRQAAIKEIGQITNDADSKGMSFSGIYFEKVYKVNENALNQVALALIEAYKQSIPSPNRTTRDDLKREVEIIIDSELERIQALTRNSYARLANNGRLHGELASKLESSRRAACKIAFQEIDIWVGLHLQIEINRYDSMLLNEKKLFENEILCKAFDNGALKPLYVLSADQIPGEWIRIGNENYLRNNDSIFHLKYRDAFEKLIEHGAFKCEGGSLYRLTDDGVSAAKNILFSQQKVSAKELQINSVDSKIANSKRLSWKNPWIRIIIAPISVGIAIFYVTSGSKMGSSSSTIVSGDWRIGDSVGRDKISGQHVVINNYIKPNNTVAPRSVNILKAKLQINRAMDDYANNVAGLKRRYGEKSGEITNSAAARGVFTSGGHVSAHIKLAIQIKESLDNEKRALDRKVEDVLMENLNKTSLQSVGSEFDSERSRLIVARKTYEELCDFLNVSTKNKELAILHQDVITKDFNVANY